MGRRKSFGGALTHQVWVRFPEPFFKELEKIASDMLLDVSTFCRVVIKEWLDNYKEQESKKE